MKMKMNVTYESFKNDTDKLKRIIKEMDSFKATMPADTVDKEAEAKRQFYEEFRRRLREAGIKVEG